MQTDGLRGANVLLDECSVTATENAVMAAALATAPPTSATPPPSRTSRSYVEFLNRLGARIENIGSNHLVIHGVEQLGGGEYTIGPDYLEVVSFIGAAAVTGGEVRIRRPACAIWT